MDKLKGDMGA